MQKDHIMSWKGYRMCGFPALYEDGKMEQALNIFCLLAGGSYLLPKSGGVPRSFMRRIWLFIREGWFVPD